MNDIVKAFNFLCVLLIFCITFSLRIFIDSSTKEKTPDGRERGRQAQQGQSKLETSATVDAPASNAKECEGIKELNYNGIIDFNNLIAFVLIVCICDTILSCMGIYDALSTLIETYFNKRNYLFYRILCLVESVDVSIDVNKCCTF